MRFCVSAYRVHIKSSITSKLLDEICAYFHQTQSSFQQNVQQVTERKQKRTYLISGRFNYPSIALINHHDPKIVTKKMDKY